MIYALQSSGDVLKYNDMKRKTIVLIFIVGAILFSVTLFSLCYLFDNKYTADGPQAVNGVLDLGEESLWEYPP